MGEAGDEKGVEPDWGAGHEEVVGAEGVWKAGREWEVSGS